MEVSRAWENAYKAYKKTDHYAANRLSEAEWRRKVLGEGFKKQKIRKPKNNRIKVNHTKKMTWLEIHREYLRWRKTEDFLKWSRKQFLRQGGTCYYCDEPLQGARQNVEHIIPKSRGGNNRKSNLVLACSRCNKAKNTTILKRKEKIALREKNLKKKGTYLTMKETYMTEEELGYSLGQLFREE